MTCNCTEFNDCPEAMKLRREYLKAEQILQHTYSHVERKKARMTFS